MKKRLVPALLALVMVLGLLPVSATAEETTPFASGFSEVKVMFNAETGRANAANGYISKTERNTMRVTIASDAEKEAELKKANSPHALLLKLPGTPTGTPSEENQVTINDETYYMIYHSSWFRPGTETLYNGFDLSLKPYERSEAQGYNGLLMAGEYKVYEATGAKGSTSQGNGADGYTWTPDTEPIGKITLKKVTIDFGEGNNVNSCVDLYKGYNNDNNGDDKRYAGSKETFFQDTVADNADIYAQNSTVHAIEIFADAENLPKSNDSDTVRAALDKLISFKPDAPITGGTWSYSEGTFTYTPPGPKSVLIPKIIEEMNNQQEGAPLHDTRNEAAADSDDKKAAISDTALYEEESYKVTAATAAASDDADIKLTVAIEGLQIHRNNADTKKTGAWVGVKFPATVDGWTISGYKRDQQEGFASIGAGSFDTVDGATTLNAYYDAGASKEDGVDDPRLRPVTVKYKNTETNAEVEIEFIVDLSGVKTVLPAATAKEDGKLSETTVNDLVSAIQAATSGDTSNDEKTEVEDDRKPTISVNFSEVGESATPTIDQKVVSALTAAAASDESGVDLKIVGQNGAEATLPAETFEDIDGAKDLRPTVKADYVVDADTSAVTAGINNAADKAAVETILDSLKETEGTRIVTVSLKQGENGTPLFTQPGSCKITVRVPVPGDTYNVLVHVGGNGKVEKKSNCEVKGEEGNQYLEVELTHLSQVFGSTEAAASSIGEAITGVTLDKETASVSVGGTVQLRATVTPANANQTVTWESSDPTVATVSNGLVTGKKAGTATITATTADGSHTDTCTVTVTAGGDNGGSTGGDNSGGSTGGDNSGGSTGGGSSGGGGGGGGGGATGKPSISNPGQTPAPGIPSSTNEGVAGFQDVAPGAWYAEYVKYVAEKGLFNGVSDGRFAPEANMTRAMMWTVLARYKGTNTNSGSGVWYAAAQAWAIENGISDGTMADANVTREQFVTMLWRLSGEPAVSNSASFTDGGRISDYAKTAVAWAVAEGIVNGYSDGSFKPQGNATRAEVAKMLTVFCTSVENAPAETAPVETAPTEAAPDDEK